MQTMRESWTDERLDEFGKRIDERFDVVHREMRQGFDQVDLRFEESRRRFEEIDKRLDRIGNGLETVQRAIIFGAISLSTAFVAGFVTLAFKV